MADNFLVIRIHPDSPVDGGTFSTYLEGLQIQVYLAGTYPGTPTHPATLLGETGVDTANLNLVQIPWLTNTFIASVSKLVESPTGPSGSKFGTSLAVQDGTGIAFGSVVTSSPGKTDLFTNNTVSVIPASKNPTTLTLAQPIPNFVPTQTAVTFYFAYGSSNPNSPSSITADWTGSNPSFQFNLKVKGKVTNSPTVNFDHSDGIAVGMTMTAATGVPADTTVIAVLNGTSITLSNNVNLANNASVTFQSNLNSGIVQHVEPLTVDTLFNTFYIPIPASVATAIIPFTTAAPLPSGNSFLDVTVVATHSGVSIPINNDFYDVIVSSGAAPTPDQYQSQPQQNTSLYLTLPPPPNPNAIDLIIPTDGTAPPFGDGKTFGLLWAMKQALTNDTNFPTGTTLDNLSTDDCSRMAYDIVWSQQGNTLPAPPDSLESLYTNPPNPGGSTGDSGNTNNLEQDRQKFEGTISSFYATRNATAERLTKFVAAASAALFCEQTSLNSKTALLEFPVDPSSSFASSVESELLLQGVDLSGTSGVNFGVPAAFFYAIGASLDKSTSAIQRFQLATGDSIERLFHVFSSTEQAGSISPSEAFQTPGITLPNITSFQAARRLSALGVYSASNSPSIQVYAGTPLANLLASWLAQTDPTRVPVPNPPLTYENTDFELWSQQLSASDPTGYLVLDLDALTQGYIISRFSKSPSAAAVAGSTTLQFQGAGLGIAPKMPVSGTNIAPGTVVTKIDTITTVTLSAPGITGSGLTKTTVVTFTSAGSPITASPNVTTPAGMTVTFDGTPVTEAIATGMKVSGTNIGPGTTVVSSITTTTVTLSAPVTGAVATTDVLMFNSPASPVVVATTVDCPSGTMLTFAGTAGIDPGVSAFGLNIKPGTAVDSKSAMTVTIHDAVLGDVPKGSLITFANLADFPSSLADQIAAWLPTTTTPPTPKPTVETVKRAARSPRCSVWSARVCLASTTCRTPTATPRSRARHPR